MVGEEDVVIALTNSKGGVGKTTLAVHLAAWSQEHGHGVVLVDADSQGASSLWLREAAPGIKAVRLPSADDVLDAIPTLQKDFGLIVVDGPAGLSEITRSILLVADLALLPCGPSVLDLRAATEAVKVVRQAQRIRHGMPEARLVPNKLQARYRLSRELLESLRFLAVPTSNGLRLRQAFADAAGQGALVWQLGRRGGCAAREIRGLFHGLFAEKS